MKKAQKGRLLFCPYRKGFDCGKAERGVLCATDLEYTCCFFFQETQREDAERRDTHDA